MQNGTLHPRIASAPVANRALKELRESIFGVMTESVKTLALGGYDTARQGGGRLRPSAAGQRGGSADSFLNSGTRSSLRKQCQDLDRNSTLARSLVMRQADLVVGDGFSLRFKTKKKEWNRAAEWLINFACGELEQGVPPPKLVQSVDLSKITPLEITGQKSMTDILVETLRAWNFDGDVGFAFVESGQAQMVEAERIVNPGRGLDRASNIVGGVEKDAAGRPIRYHIATWNDQGSYLKPSTTAVPAEHFLLALNPLRKLTGATRGEPQLQACVSRIEHLDGMDEAVRVGARLQACIPAYIQLENPLADQLSAPGTTEDRGDGTNEQWEEWEAGLVKRLGTNERIVFPPMTQPGASLMDYFLMQVMLICAELGLPLPVAMLDGRQVNLSTIRSILQVATLRSIRLQKALKAVACRHTYFKTAWLIKEGFLPFNSEWMAFEYLPPPPPVMDLKTEVEAARAMMDARFKSQGRIMQETWGIDKDAEDEAIAAEIEKNNKLGIAPVAAPGSGPGGSAGPGSAATGAESNSEDADPQTQSKNAD